MENKEGRQYDFLSAHLSGTLEAIPKRHPNLWGSAIPYLTALMICCRADVNQRAWQLRQM